MRLLHWLTPIRNDRIRRAWLISSAFVPLLLLSGCSEPPVYKQQSYVFGTLVEVSIYGESEDKAKSAVARVLADFDEMHKTLHAWQPSTLGRINAILAQAPASAALPPGLLPILDDATRLSVQSDGLFNPAIGNLIQLWGFQSDTFEAKLPDPAEIERLVAANPQMTDIQINGLQFKATNPAVHLDFGGYAKGYALDVAADYLKSQGIKNALINIGGNIMALGQHGKRSWKIGIQHPRKAGAIAMLELKDGEAIGTSGDYQRYFELDGKRYCHLIDPRTGWPVQGVQAVTVLARGKQAGVMSDVASKPLFIAGSGAWRPMAEKMGISDALLIDSEGRIQVTQSLANRLEWVEGTPKATVVP